MVSVPLLPQSVEEGLSVLITVRSPCWRRTGLRLGIYPLTSLTPHFSLWTGSLNDAYIHRLLTRAFWLSISYLSWHYSASVAAVEKHPESLRKFSCPNRNLEHWSRCPASFVFVGAGRWGSLLVPPRAALLCLWSCASWGLKACENRGAPSSRPFHPQVLTGTTLAERKTRRGGQLASPGCSSMAE